MGKETDIQVQEAQRIPNKINPKRTIPRHTVIKIAKIKDKEGILETAREDFPGGAVVKNPPANAGDMGSSPGLGRSHMPWSN